MKCLMNDLLFINHLNIDFARGDREETLSCAGRHYRVDLSSV